MNECVTYPMHHILTLKRERILLPTCMWKLPHSGLNPFIFWQVYYICKLQLYLYGHQISDLSMFMLCIQPWVTNDNKANKTQHKYNNSFQHHTNHYCTSVPYVYIPILMCFRSHTRVYTESYNTYHCYINSPLLLTMSVPTTIAVMDVNLQINIQRLFYFYIKV